MKKAEFLEVFESEMNYYRVKLDGETLDEIDKSKKSFLASYYPSLQHLNVNQLKSAFEKCRGVHEWFPKVVHILKFCPKKKVADYQDPAKNHEYTEEGRALANKIHSKMKGPIYQIGEKQVRENIAFCQSRWPNSDWDEALNRELDADKKRLKGG